jgi:LmbE family N-acetylglucosaminyl deacetylase
MDQFLMPTALSLLAHPDDAEFLCAGTLARLSRVGWSIHIVTATAGDCGTTTQDAAEISTTRKAEAEKSAAMIGGSYHCLGELDGRVVYDKATIQKTIDLFRRINPALVFTHAPRDYMMDHEMTCMLARSASQIFGARNASSVALAGGGAIPHLYYCDPVEGLDPFGQTPAPSVIVDISAEMETKTRMLACHASQREWLRAHQGLDEYVEAMRRHAGMRGKMIEKSAGEGFIQHRSHGYPGNDLLSELLGNA